MTFLGIEIGGTKLQLGVGPGDGTLTRIERLAVSPEAGAEGIRRQILAAAPTLLDGARGIGIGFGGPVDDATRRPIRSHQVSGWDDFPLAEWAERELGLPAVLGNDADLAGLAEARFGAGRGFSPLFYMNVGSGIGGALVIDGEVYRGFGRGAGEIGHVRIDGRTLEEAASCWAIAKAAGRGRDAAAVVRDAASGDSAASAVLGAAVEKIALALTHVVAICAPRRIVMGGGLSLAGERFLGPLRDAVTRLAFAPFAGGFDIVPAALGEDVVVHGALALAATQARPSRRS